jgi:non-heme chloroperoxidase
MLTEDHARPASRVHGNRLSPELPRISVPTLLIHGDNDKSTPIETTARKTAPLIPGSQLKVYEGAAHGLPITHADQLNADLLAFAKG